MKDWLARIEVQYDVEILFACEAGSRAWGYSSVESDHDIRFIYKHKNPSKYLSLDEPLEVITVKQPFDTQGWDIKKTFRLMRKSNPNVFEWCYTPVIYIEKAGFRTRMQNLVEKGYSSYALGKHYLSLSKRNRQTLSNDRFTDSEQKKLLYCLRSLLIVKQLANYGEISRKLLQLDVDNAPQNLGSRYYSKLILAKQQGKLFSLEQKEQIIFVIDQLIDECSREVENLNRGMNLTEDLNKWLWELIH